MLSYYSYKDYSELTYWELKKMSSFVNTRQYEDTSSLKKRMKNCLDEILESKRKKICSLKRISLKNESVLEGAKIRSLKLSEN